MTSKDLTGLEYKSQGSAFTKDSSLMESITDTADRYFSMGLATSVSSVTARGATKSTERNLREI